MIISSDIFEAYLICPSKCWFRFRGEKTAGNIYSQWLQKQNQSYRKEALKRLLDSVHKTDSIVAPSQFVNIKEAKWRLAADFVVRKDNIEASIHAIGRLFSDNKPDQLIPMRFAFSNKLTKGDKLLLAFDSLVLSEAFKHEISHGKIIYGDRYSETKVKVSLLTREVRKSIGKIATLIGNNAPPEVVLKRHCQECVFQAICRKKAIDKDDLSLLVGMNEKERKKYNSKGIFTVTQLSYTFRPHRRLS